MRWVECTQGDFSGEPPSPRSGHSAVVVNGSMLVVFGGLRDSKFLGDVVVLDIANKTWFHPECRGGGPEGEVGPGPRAFHVAVSIDCHMFIFGGRSGRKRQGDFWMLDTDTWQWVELTGYGDLPPPRDFAAGVSAGNGNLVICGGSDGNKWTSDVYVLNTISLEWTLVRGASPMPPPRCAHAAVMVENRHSTQSIETRLLMFGGRGGGGPILGDLWVFKGVAGEESPAWTKLTLPGPVPAPRCGHSMTPSGTQVWVFGGQSTGGWLTRYDIYYNDSVVLDRASGVQWKRPNISNEPPPARAYHTMTAIGNRFLLFGGYNGKTTFGDAWFLVPEDDPLAKRIQPKSPSEKTKSASSTDSRGSNVTDKRPGTPRSSVESKDDVNRVKGLSELRVRLGLPPVELATGRFWDSPLDGSGNAALVNLGLKLMEGEDRAKEAETRETTALPMEAASVARKYLSECEPTSLRLCQLQALLDDYRILVAAKHEQWRVREQCQQHRFARRKKKKDGKDDEDDNKERSEVKELSAERSIMPPSSVVSTAVVKVSAPSSNSLCSLFYRLRRLGSRKGDNCSDNSSNRKKRSIAKWLCCRISVIADLAMHPCGGDRRRTLSRGQTTPASVGETPDSVASSNHQWPSQTPSPLFSSSLDKTPVARHHFYHLRNASQVRLDDIPKLLEEYRQLLRELHQSATPSTAS